MTKKDAPGYPGDEAINKAIGEALREIRLETVPRRSRGDIPAGQSRRFKIHGTARFGHRGEATPGKTRHDQSTIESCFWIICPFHRPS